MIRFQLLELVQQISTPTLSDRLRPGAECAPWVIAEVKKLETALALQGKQVAFSLDDEELKALIRFGETCEDGEAYDVPLPMMEKLSRIGVVRLVRTDSRIGSVRLAPKHHYELTAFGECVLNAHTPEMIQEASS